MSILRDRIRKKNQVLVNIVVPNVMAETIIHEQKICRIRKIVHTIYFEINK